jgi:hypothetical protein
MAKKTAEVPPAASAAAPADTQNLAPTRPTNSGGKIAAFVVGGVVAAALLFGGGIATGIALPIGDGGRPGIGQLPGGQQPQGGPQFGGQDRGGQPGGSQPSGGQQFGGQPGGRHDRDGDRDGDNGAPNAPSTPNQDSSTNN